METWRYKAKQVKWWNPEDTKFDRGRWTSISEIGQKFNGEVLSWNKYLDIENKYIQFFELIFEVENISYLNVESLEIYYTTEEDTPKYLDEKLDSLLKEILIKQPIKVDKDSIRAFCKLILREYIWCALISPDKSFELRFGYDYYVYLVSKQNHKWVEVLKSIGLYI